MASFVRNNPLNNPEPIRIDEPQNPSPIRIALLGGGRTGKTSIISKLTQGIFAETYYPTVRTNSNLFTYVPTSTTSRVILTGDTAKLKKFESNNLRLSNVLKNLRPVPKKPVIAQDTTGLEVVIHRKTEFYKSYNDKSQLEHMSDSIPDITPMLVEAIDTPAYKSNFIPFLESSLYTNLDKDVLKNLANEPRKDVLAMPLLVASGAGELNASVHGYFYVYSAIPSYSPPSYGDDLSENQPEDSLTILKLIKNSIDEAWREFYTYQKKWDEGKESDIYSVKHALKSFLSSKNLEEEESKKLSKRKIYKELLPVPTDPSDPFCPPPIWVICTHTKSPLASPHMVESGRQTAKTWGCGFMAMDVNEEDVDKVLALMIREVCERKRL